MPGNSKNPSSGRSRSNKAAGSGGRNKRGLAGRGPTPKAEDRVYHKAYKAKQEALKRAQNQPKRNRTPKSSGDWIAGRNPVLEALLADLDVKAVYLAEGIDRDERIRQIMTIAAERSIPLMQTSRLDLDNLTGGATHQGVAVKLPPFSYAEPGDVVDAALADPETNGLVVVLDSVTDPHNLGAIVRSAAAFGAHGVIIPQRRSASMTAAAWKSSAGAAARIPVAMCTNLNHTLQDLRKAGFFVVGLAGEAEADITEAVAGAGPLVLVIGSEGSGLSRLVRENCDQLASIPISSSVESLNASVACAICLYEVMRCRG